MHKVLLVEDEINKAREIKNVLETNYKTTISFKEVKSIQGALNELRDTHFDIVLLDMSLPLADSDDSFQTFGGINILEELIRIESLSKVIVITAFDTLVDRNETVKLTDLDEEMRDEYEEMYCGSIHYNISTVEWESLLLNKINEIIGVNE